jgi:hypothetical protein
MTYSGTGGTGGADLTMFAAGVHAAIGANTLSVPQGRSVALPVSVQSLGGPDTDVTFDLGGDTGGLAIADPVVHVPSQQTVNTVVHVVAGRDAPLGDHVVHVASSAYGGDQSQGLGDVTVTVTPLPVLHADVDLRQLADTWNQARASNCEIIKDLMGRAVLAAIGRTIRDPDCYLAPLQLSAHQDGGTIALAASIPGNWVSAYVTTPDGLPRDLDPKFSLNYDVSAALAIHLPQTLDGNTRLRVSDPSLVLSNVYLDSHNLTGDILEAAASWFGGAQYFQPATVALTPYLGQAVDDVNAALSPLDPLLQQAAQTGFTQIAESLDPVTLQLNITIS